jgi:hypothetical protein
MRKLEFPDKVVFGIGWGAIVLGLWIAWVGHKELVGLLVALLGLLMIVSSLRPTVGSIPFLKRWRDKREKRRQAARQRVAQEKLRQEIVPHLKGWRQFHAAAGKVVMLFYALRNREPGKDWESFQDAVRLAINLAGELETYRPRASELLKPFIGIEQDALEHHSAAVIDLSDWIFMVGGHLCQLRMQAGLPPSADQPSSKPSE